jgi:MFS transporter, OFA family, oxalate/formate antiporter
MTVSELSEQARCAELEMPRPSLFYGWIIVWAAFVLLMLSSGITYSTPVLFHLFETDFGIGRGQAAFIFSFSQVMAFVIGPIAGSLAEKRGPRMVVGGGVVLLAAGLVAASLAKSYTPLLVCYGVATGFGSGAIYVPLLGLIQRWFYKRRGFASGLATTGVSVGTLTFPLLAASAADAFGWRSLYVGFAIVCVSVGLLAAFVLVADPGERGLNPDGEADAAMPRPGEATISGMSLGEALRDRQFYQLYFCSFGAAVLSFMALVHLPQYVAEVSGERLYAAAIISVIGLASLVSRVGGGSWADRIGRIAMIRVARALMLITSILWLANSFTNLWGVSVYFAVAALFGITYGLCIALLPTVIADSFGNKEISRIIGTVYTSFALAGLLGPTAAGLLRDRFGNYDVALMVCIALALATLIVSAGLRRRY